MSDYTYGIWLARMFSFIPGVLGMESLCVAVYQLRFGPAIPGVILLGLAIFIYKTIANVAEERRQKGIK